MTLSQMEKGIVMAMKKEITLKSTPKCSSTRAPFRYFRMTYLDYGKTIIRHTEWKVQRYFSSFWRAPKVISIAYVKQKARTSIGSSRFRFS